MFRHIINQFTQTQGFGSKNQHTSSSTTTPPPRIISQVATPHYWYHLCLQDTKVYTPLDQNTKPYSSCQQCGYVPKYDTILTNEEYQPVETLLGKNLLPQRFTPYLVRCGACKQTSKNYLPTHPEFVNRTAQGLWPGYEICNNCRHYHPHQTPTTPGYGYHVANLLNNLNPRQAELSCRNCTIVNPFGEDFICFLRTQQSVYGHHQAGSDPSITLIGGPLDRHNKAIRMEREIQVLQRQQMQRWQQMGYDDAATTTTGRNLKRKTEMAGLEEGMRDPTMLPTQGQLNNHPPST